MGKLSALPQDSTPTGDDYTVTVDTGSGQTKKVLISDLFSQGLIGASGLNFSSFDVYSTSETDTGRKWTDGRTIYRKVIRSSLTVAATATNNVAHGITGLTTSWEMVRISGAIKLSSGGTNSGNQEVSFAYRELAGHWFAHTSTDTTNVTFTASYAWGASWVTIVMEYVK